MQAPAAQMCPLPQSVPSGALPLSMHWALPEAQAVTPFLQPLRWQEAPSVQSLHLPAPQTLFGPQDWPFPQSLSSQSVLPSQSSSRPFPQFSAAFGFPSRHMVVEQLFETQAKAPGQSVS
jgi:hypothetical protein